MHTYVVCDCLAVCAGLVVLDIYSNGLTNHPEMHPIADGFRLQDLHDWPNKRDLGIWLIEHVFQACKEHGEYPRMGPTILCLWHSGGTVSEGMVGLWLAACVPLRVWRAPGAGGLVLPWHQI